MGGFLSRKATYREGAYKKPEKPKEKERGAKATFRALRLHPNFRFPRVPKDKTPEAVAAFVIEACARFASPPKTGDEDEEFSCIDVATAMREMLAPQIIGKLKPKRRAKRA